MNLAISKTVSGTIEEVCAQVTEKIKPAGFGILTRIDFDKKIQEKLGKRIPQTVVLGACNPGLAFEAFQQSTDVALMIPCNIVVRDLGAGQVVVEAMRPSAMLNFLPNLKLGAEVATVEKQLEEAILSLK